MEVQIHYDNLADRRIKAKEKEALDLRMLHDDFDPDWKPGDEPHGTMTFTDAPEPEPPIIPDSPDVVLLKQYMADPHSGLPPLEDAFQALVRLYLGIS